MQWGEKGPSKQIKPPQNPLHCTLLVINLDYLLNCLHFALALQYD